MCEWEHILVVDGGGGLTYVILGRDLGREWRTTGGLCEAVGFS